MREGGGGTQNQVGGYFCVTSKAISMHGWWGLVLLSQSPRSGLGDDQMIFSK